jgi:hypothetical protein
MTKQRKQVKMLLRSLGLAALWVVAAAGQTGSHGQYVGGTLGQLQSGSGVRVDMSDERYLALYAHKANIRVAYQQVNLLEYGQKVDRRYIVAALVSPLFLLAKKKDHYLTVGYSDDRGMQQAVVLRIEKGSIRPTLVSLEARTGLKVQFQDDDARRSGKGS